MLNMLKFHCGACNSQSQVTLILPLTLKGLIEILQESLKEGCPECKANGKPSHQQLYCGTLPHISSRD